MTDAMAEAVRRVVDDAPPLTEDQVQVLGALIDAGPVARTVEPGAA